MLSSQRKEITSSLKVNHTVYVIIGKGLFSVLNGPVVSLGVPFLVHMGLMKTFELWISSLNFVL